MEYLLFQITLEAPLKVTQPKQVEVPPSLTPMKGLTVMEGEKMRLSTKVSGKPTPKIQWYREGTLIPNNPDFLVSFVPKFFFKNLSFIFGENFTRKTHFVKFSPH